MTRKIAAGSPLTTAVATQLRAAAVVAGELLLDLVNGEGAADDWDPARLRGSAVEAGAPAGASPGAAASAATLGDADASSGRRLPLSASEAVATLVDPALAGSRRRAVLSGALADYYFYTLGKSSDAMRAVPRHVQRSTVFY